MVYAGIDVGSVASKAVVLGDSGVESWAIEPTGWSPREAGRKVLAIALQEAGRARDEVRAIVATGYGRAVLSFADKAVTEITCHALGASFHYPQNNLVIDVGGQDSKAILIDDRGRVLKFVMNDKCAAGTGRFLQVMAVALGMDIQDLNYMQLSEPVNINSMCTVFAESEVVSLLAAGESRDRIISGLYQSVAKRVSAMTYSMGNPSGVTFTGGVARIAAMKSAICRELGCPVHVPGNPQIVGALGAALIAKR